MNERRVNILWMYPDILNLHGDRGNAAALLRVCAQFGADARLTRVNRLTDDFDLERADILLFGPGELAVMPDVLAALSPWQDALRNFADAGKGIFAIGTSGALLARRTERQDCGGFAGLGLLDMTLWEREVIYGDDLIVRVEDRDAACGEEGTMDLGGIQIRMTDAFLAAGQNPLARVLYGMGNSEKPSRARVPNGEGNNTPERLCGEAADTMAEGAQRGNVIFTNLLGPVFVKNPWFALRLIRRVLTCKYPDADIVAETDARLAAQGKTREDIWAMEIQSARAVSDFNKAKTPAPEAIG